MTTGKARFARPRIFAEHRQDRLLERLISGVVTRYLDLSVRASGFSNTLSAYCLRAKQRRQLGQLSDVALKDMGISRCEAIEESDKPFWKG
jgi:uncharacterized protein YjiS (DUF1127 family)